MIAIAGATFGLMLWVGGVIGAIYILARQDPDLDTRIGNAGILVIIMGILGFLVSLHGLYTPLRGVHYTYEVPTSITKTQGVTMVTHVVSNKVAVTGNFLTSNYWLSTNIMVRVASGKNFYNFDVPSTYEIVLP